MYIYIYIYIYIYTHTAYSIASTLNQNLLGLVFVCDCDPHVSLSCVCVLELLSMDDVETLLDATGCSAEIKRPVCKGDCLSERYRTITGHCNNRQNPLLGAANTPYARWLPPAYEDFHGTPRGWNPQHTYNNFTLPPVRIVSQEVLYTQNEKISLDLSLSHLLVEWGQWIDHDLSLTPQSPSTASFRTGADCIRTCSRDTPCFPIQIPFSDPRRGVQRCMPFFRSAPSCVDASVVCRHREQLNAITAFVDANMVYGSSDALAQSLRNLSSPLGLLTHNHLHSDQGLAYLPYLPRKQLDPCAPRQGSNTGKNTTSMGNLTFCYLAGDSRANEHLGMIALHTLFLREHNRLAKELHILNPHWSPDTLYQEARKILGAVHQVLTWDYYLPHVLGHRAYAELMAPYQGYDPEVDPSITNGFSTAAFRFAHVTVQPIVNRLGPGYKLDPKHPPLPLHHSLFASWRVVEEGGIDPVLRGLLLSPAKLQAPEQMMVEELTERLFQAHGGLPLDLGALNLQRGRDHGLPDPVCGSIPRLKVGFSVMCNSAVLYQCPSGYLLRGATHITCDPNTRLWTPNPPTCQDIDECFSGPVCPPNLLCHNTPGSFICTESTTHSATSIAAAVMTMVGGVAVMVLIVTCYTRFIRKGSISRACCNKKH
ncbi:thyroid peroxidase isoform X7 [Neoarius graeffei]|uniref:thyroid peroxidase isoform X7 n=1 Tax=Neoarius graeffei TaxID=443677 RepID=UPI00298D587C|nr:thyroid peroxidase isoform X7 [Neoarius graeffei]